MGINTVDNFVADRINGDNSPKQVFNGVLELSFNGVGGLGKGKPKMGGGKIKAVYPDGVKVYSEFSPPRLGEAVPRPGETGFAHTQLRWDVFNGRVYQAREFNAAGMPVRDIDFTIPTFPDGRPRPNHVAPEQHLWIQNQTGGSMQRGPGTRYFW